MLQAEVKELHSPTEYPFDPKLKDEEEAVSDEDDSELSPPVDIVAFNELRSCADLLRMVNSNPPQIDIAPDFQRGFVWKPADQTRFIDSLIKELPIPSLCISYDYKTNKRLVIDGKQRITTIIQFLANPTFKLSSLKDIDERISGKDVATIKKNDTTKILYEKVENLMIPITVIRCDSSNRGHMQYLFKIFHRLNSGGTKLNNQEIRNGIYSGLFNSFIKDIVINNESFKALMKIDDNVNYRFAYEELILRFFALYDGLASYTGNLSSFLNDYMHYKTQLEISNSESLITEIDKKEKLFKDTIDLIYEKIFDSKPMEHKSKAFIEALIVAVCSNLNSLKDKDPNEVKGYYVTMDNNVNFGLDNLKEGVAKKTKVIDRIKKAIEIFSGKEA